MVDREKDLYFNPDGESSPIPLPVEMQFGHRDGITGKESLREIFSIIVLGCYPKNMVSVKSTNLF